VDFELRSPDEGINDHHRFSLGGLTPSARLRLTKEAQKYHKFSDFIISAHLK
jgi:hypothetical protein